MGLDMYLHATRSVGGWSHRTDPEYVMLAALMHVTPCEESPCFSVEATVAYWSKANAVHKWFVDNVQGGVDNCQPHSVTSEQLQQLLELCKSLLKKHARLKPAAFANAAKETLPVREGFFFSSPGYGERYVADLKATVRQLEACLGDPQLINWEFNYRASW